MCWERDPDLVVSIGHPGTAEALGVKPRRDNIALEVGDVAYVAQPVGGRLAPGQEIAAPDLGYFLVRVHGPGLIESLQEELAELREAVAEFNAILPPPSDEAQRDREAAELRMWFDSR